MPWHQTSETPLSEAMTAYNNGAYMHAQAASMNYAQIYHSNSNRSKWGYFYEKCNNRDSVVMKKHGLSTFET